MVLRVDDTNPKDKSSMMLWCVDFGEFGIALVAGIDRQEKSHVTAYAERHGDHSVQHVAFQVPNLVSFRDVMVEQCGLKTSWGPSCKGTMGSAGLRQVFAKGYNTNANPAEVGFPEFVERPA